jgi:hypothetical protein
MQHIINIAFDFDDDAVRKTAQKAVENDLDNRINNLILDHIAPFSYGNPWNNGKRERNWSSLDSKVEAKIQDFLAEHKEEIIDRASDKLIKSLQRTKAWKEKYSETI